MRFPRSLAGIALTSLLAASSLNCSSRNVHVDGNLDNCDELAKVERDSYDQFIISAIECGDDLKCLKANADSAAVCFDRFKGIYGFKTEEVPWDLSYVNGEVARLQKNYALAISQYETSLRAMKYSKELTEEEKDFFEGVLARRIMGTRLIMEIRQKSS